MWDKCVNEFSFLQKENSNLLKNLRNISAQKAEYFLIFVLTPMNRDKKIYVFAFSKY